MSAGKTQAGEDPIFFVGDIQGCLEPLERLLRQAGYNPDHHRFIPIGDTINRGTENVGVLTLLRRLGAEPILGNHEDKLLRALSGPRPSEWIARQSLSRDFMQDPGRDEWLEWIRTWPSYRQEANWLAVHAGVHPVKALEDTPKSFLVNVRLCNAEGELPQNWDGANDTFPEGYRPWYEYYRGDLFVLYGHWARWGFRRDNRTLGLDSGCVYGKTLTGWWYPEDRLVQVPGAKGPAPFQRSRSAYRGSKKEPN